MKIYVWDRFSSIVHRILHQVNMSNYQLSYATSMALAWLATRPYPGVGGQEVFSPSFKNNVPGVTNHFQCATGLFRHGRRTSMLLSTSNEQMFLLSLYHHRCTRSQPHRLLRIRAVPFIELPQWVPRTTSRIDSMYESAMCRGNDKKSSWTSPAFGPDHLPAPATTLGCLDQVFRSRWMMARPNVPPL